MMRTRRIILAQGAMPSSRLHASRSVSSSVYNKRMKRGEGEGAIGPLPTNPGGELPPFPPGPLGPRR